VNFFEYIRISINSVKVNKMRSFLTMLGIIIGVSAVIAMVAIGQGASKSVSSSIQGLGSNLLIVSPGQAQQGGIKLGAGSFETLTLADADAIRKESAIAGAAPDVSQPSQVVMGDQNYATTIEGTTADYPTVRSTEVQRGRFFTDFEVMSQANVAVVGTQVVENLMGDAGANPVGQTIEINQMKFTIIGELASQGSQGATNNDDRIVIPITTAMNRLFDLTKVRTIFVSAKSNDLMNQAQFEITEAVRAQHHLEPADNDDFQITSQAQILSTAQGVTGVLTALLAGIAGISLVVGGIGIMNIMLVSVTERTREIGIRKAIGATRSAIMAQFLIEAIVLSLFGGLIGIMLGVGISTLVDKVTTLHPAITLSPILYAFFFSMIIGVVFGVYPARKAARLNPIDALRYE